jgi:Flp pilus assembly pilin Flp
MDIIQTIETQQGQTMVEYGFVLLFVAIVAVVTLVGVGTDLQNIFGSVASKF